MPRKTKRRQKIDYQMVIKDVAKSMVRLKQPERLLKMVTKYIDKQFGLTHTSIAIFEEHKNRFIFVDSKGSGRFPIGLVKIDLDHPLVHWFHKARKVEEISQDYLSCSMLKKWTGEKNKALIHKKTGVDVDRLKKMMESLKIDLVIPGYYKNSLLGLMLLGKRNDHRRFTAPEISFFQTITQHCSMAVKSAEYHRSLIERNVELQKRIDEIEMFRKKERETYFEVMRALAHEVDAKDSYTFGHVGQVEYFGFLVAHEMGVCTTGKKRDILEASLILHDIGKIGIPDNVLNKPGRLNEEEWNIMKTHSEKGADILRNLTAFREVAEIVHCHHERFDGSGYPRGLKGEEIPLEARIVSVADSFHAIISSRCYSSSKSIYDAFEELTRCAGSQFDPNVVTAFIRGMVKEIDKKGADFLSNHESCETS